MTKKEAVPRSFEFIRWRNCLHRLLNDRLRFREPQASSRGYIGKLATGVGRITKEENRGRRKWRSDEPSFQQRPRDCAVLSTLTPAHWTLMLWESLNKQISVSKVEFRLLLALLVVVQVFGDLTPAVPAATPTTASEAGRSIAEIRML